MVASTLWVTGGCRRHLSHLRPLQRRLTRLLQVRLLFLIIHHQSETLRRPHPPLRPHHQLSKPTGQKIPSAAAYAYTSSVKPR